MSCVSCSVVFNACSEVSRLFAMFFYASMPDPRQVPIKYDCIKGGKNFYEARPLH